MLVRLLCVQRKKSWRGRVFIRRRWEPGNHITGTFSSPLYLSPRAKKNLAFLYGSICYWFARRGLTVKIMKRKARGVPAQPSRPRPLGAQFDNVGFGPSPTSPMACPSGLCVWCHLLLLCILVCPVEYMRSLILCSFLIHV